MTSTNGKLHCVTDQDGAAILDSERGTISTLNPTGALIWQRLQRGESIATVIANLVRETGEETLLVERDVYEFVQSLRENHLLSC